MNIISSMFIIVGLFVLLGAWTNYKRNIPDQNDENFDRLFQD